ncbi:hypothetical protein CRENBAI_019309 [Crenichthys baileyi]|uniref:Uncharacterized protein n=1 Tax=Crenichthys baileyi TaxID=28760 RepID=A0AAV9QWZ4_9TELE
MWDFSLRPQISVVSRLKLTGVTTASQLLSTMSPVTRVFLGALRGPWGSSLYLHDHEPKPSDSIQDGSTQTSVTTKSVTCQTSAGDDEDQHQPASLKELKSQTSAKSDAMQDEMGPPQLSDGLLAEFPMSRIPPQPFSPPSPYPQSSRLCIALLRDMDGSGSPQLMSLPHHLSSRRSLYHLPF